VLFTSDNFSDYTPEQKKTYEAVIALQNGQFLSCQEEKGHVTVSYSLDGAEKRIIWNISR
jgi:hypothetical protein